MANLAQARRRLTWTIAGFAVLDVAAVLVLFAPWAPSPAAQRQQLNDVQAQIQLKTRQVIPPDQMDKRVSEAREQIGAFYEDRFPDEFSTIPDKLGKVAAETGVMLSKAKYDPPEATVVRDLRRVNIEATLVGNYLHEMKFINALERDKTFFLVNSVTLGEQTGGNVRLELKLEAYLKGPS